MKLPFPDWCLVTPIKVYSDVEDENGIETKLIFDGNANFSEKSRTVINAEQQLITLSGRCIIKGDISPNEPIKGYIELWHNGKLDGKRQIYSYQKLRNPDGSIFSTELDLI